MGFSPLRPTGFTHHRPPKSDTGYTLITPPEGHYVVLLGMNGAAAHR
ncbi:MAG: hypothetical protein O7G84_19580 [Gammaproteobacteria bacterium]|nr:hypothetical protein [Gammaproteobacteria bacterium]